MGQSVKLVLAIIDSISNKKKGGGIFSSCKVGHKGQGGVRELRFKGHKKKLIVI